MSKQTQSGVGKQNTNATTTAILLLQTGEQKNEANGTVGGKKLSADIFGGRQRNKIKILLRFSVMYVTIEISSLEYPGGFFYAPLL